jgi:hypothetical protein
MLAPTRVGDIESQMGCRRCRDGVTDGDIS